jgi:uncharacterized phage infection (PIP) family protein YhgE
VSDLARQEAADHWASQLDSPELSDRISALAEVAAEEIVSREVAKVRTELSAEFGKKVDGIAEELHESLRGVDESVDNVANLMREEIAKLRTSLEDIKEDSGSSDELDDIRDAAERSNNLVREETQRFSRELQSSRSRSSEQLADLKAELEKIRSFVREEILQLGEAVEDARRTINEKAGTVDEGSVRKIVKKIIKEAD